VHDPITIPPTKLPPPDTTPTLPDTAPELPPNPPPKVCLSEKLLNIYTGSEVLEEAASILLAGRGRGTTAHTWAVKQKTVTKHALESSCRADGRGQHVVLASWN